MKIKIAKQHFFNNGDLLLEFLKDSEENLVKEDVSAAQGLGWHYTGLCRARWGPA